MTLDPAQMTHVSAPRDPEQAPLPVQPAPLLPPGAGREAVTALLKPRHREWLEARAAAHGESVEMHVAGLLTGLWQTDPWRLGQVPSMTRPGVAGRRAG